MLFDEKFVECIKPFVNADVRKVIKTPLYEKIFKLKNNLKNCITGSTWMKDNATANLILDQCQEKYQAGNKKVRHEWLENMKLTGEKLNNFTPESTGITSKPDFNKAFIMTSCYGIIGNFVEQFKHSQNEFVHEMQSI